jgi:transketolase
MCAFQEESMAGHDPSLIAELVEKARLLRLVSLEMICRRGAGHPGGCLSAAEIMAVLFFHRLRIDPGNPLDPDRDRFILSKGHASAILYAALAERGFFPRADLERWGELECHLQGHPERLKTPGVDMTTGVLGHGINVGAGLALAARLNGQEYRTYVLLGDGECQGGIIWEGAMTAGKYRLSNLTLIVDFNGVQLDGFVRDIMPLEPFKEKWRAFNLAVIEIDGHDIGQLLDALQEAEGIRDRTTVVLARTVKGKGVSFMENQSYWHGVAPSPEQLEQARRELLQEAGR